MKRPILALLLLSSFSASAEEKKDDAAKSPPAVLMTIPLAVKPGETLTMRLRGTGLADATTVRCADARSTAKIEIKSKAKAAVPERMDAKRAGDSQVEIELTLSADTPAKPLALVVVTATGESAPHDARVVSAESLMDEKEPNDGFRQAQPIQFNQTVRGQIEKKQDVDVFRFEGKAGQKIIAKAVAARLGSALDATLTLHDARGHVLAAADDSGPDSADPILRAALPADGVYHLALADANDRGGASPYLLSLRVDE